MSAPLLVPGVQHEDVIPAGEAALRTGVPVFVGFVATPLPFNSATLVSSWAQRGAAV